MGWNDLNWINRDLMYLLHLLMFIFNTIEFIINNNKIRNKKQKKQIWFQLMIVQLNTIGNIFIRSDHTIAGAVISAVPVLVSGVAREGGVGREGTREREQASKLHTRPREQEREQASKKADASAESRAAKEDTKEKDDNEEIRLSVKVNFLFSFCTWTLALH